MRILPVLIVLASAVASAAVDPALLALVAPDTKVLYGMQVQQALASPFGQFAMARMPDHGAALLQFATATGFDLRRDLQEILLASSTGTGRWQDGIILARGTFQPGKFADLASSIGARVTDYHGFSLVTLPEGGARCFSFLDSSTLAIGSETILQGVIDRRGSQGASNAALASKARTASEAGDAWFATVTPLVELVPSAPGPLPTGFLQAVIESSASLQFTASGVTLSAEAITHSTDEASGLAGALKFVAGMAKGPQATFLQSAQFTTSGPATRITLSVAETDLERAFPSPAQGRAAR